MLKKFWAFLNLKLEKILSLLSICVIILCFSCANARVLSEVDIANFTLNAYRYKYNAQPSQTILDNISARIETTFKEMSTITSNNEGHYILGSYDGNNIDLFWWTGSQQNLNNNLPYFGASNITYINTNYLVGHKVRYTVSTNNYDTAFSSPYNTNTSTYFYTDSNIKSALNNSTIKWSAGYTNPTNAFDENWFSSIKWELNANSNNTITIPNRTETFYTMNKGTFTTTLATLQDSVYAEQVMMLISAYNGTNWQVVNDRELFNKDNQIISNTFPSVTERRCFKKFYSNKKCNFTN